MGDVGRRTDVREADGLATARVVGDRQHYQRHAVRRLGQQRFQPLEVDVALEWIQLVRRVSLGSHQIHGLGAGRLDVAASRVEVGIGRNDPARPADDRKQDRLGRAALVGGNDVPERHQLAHRRLESIERRRAGVRLVAAHHGAPLLGAHRAGARIGEQVDDHVVRMDREQVPAGLAQQLAAFLHRRQPDRLDHLDAERLDDGLHGRALLRRTSAPTASTISSRSVRPPPPPPPPPPPMTGNGGDIVTVAVAELAAVCDGDGTDRDGRRTRSQRRRGVEAGGRDRAECRIAACHVVDEPVHARIGCVRHRRRERLRAGTRDQIHRGRRHRNDDRLGNRDWRRAGWPAGGRRRRRGRGRRAHDDVRRVLASRVIGDSRDAR